MGRNSQQAKSVEYSSSGPHPGDDDYVRRHRRRPSGCFEWSLYLFAKRRNRCRQCEKREKIEIAGSSREGNTDSQKSTSVAVSTKSNTGCFGRFRLRRSRQEDASESSQLSSRVG